MRPSEALAKHREEVREILLGYHVENPRVFGSSARGEDTASSDLDIIVERKGMLTYFDLAELERELEALLGVKVDVRTVGEFSNRALARIQGDFREI